MICGWYFLVWRWKHASKLFKTLDCRRAQLFVPGIYISSSIDVERSTQFLLAQERSLCDVFWENLAADHQDDPHAKDTSWSLGKAFLKFFFGKRYTASLRKSSQAQKTPASLMSATGSFWERPTSFQDFSWPRMMPWTGQISQICLIDLIGCFTLGGWIFKASSKRMRNSISGRHLHQVTSLFVKVVQSHLSPKLQARIHTCFFLLWDLDFHIEMWVSHRSLVCSLGNRM